MQVQPPSGLEFFFRGSDILLAEQDPIAAVIQLRYEGTCDDADDERLHHTSASETYRFLGIYNGIYSESRGVTAKNGGKRPETPVDARGTGPRDHGAQALHALRRPGYRGALVDP